MKSLVPAAVALVLLVVPAFAQIAVPTNGGGPGATNAATNRSVSASNDSLGRKDQRAKSAASPNAIRNKNYRKLQEETAPSPRPYR